MAAMWNWLIAVFCSRLCSRQSSGAPAQFRNALRGRIEQQVFGQPALFLRNRGEALQLLGVDDGEVEPGLGAVIEEDRIDHFARRRRQAEGDVRNAEDRLDVRDLRLDQPEGLDGLHRAADVVLVAGGAGEDQRIDDDVLGAGCRISL